MEDSMEEITNAQNAIESAKPKFLPSFLPSLCVCFLVGLLLTMICQPMYLKLVMKHYHIS